MKKKEILTLIWYRNRTGELHTSTISINTFIIAACMTLFIIILSISLSVFFYLKSSRLKTELRNVKDEKLLAAKASGGEVLSPVQEQDATVVKKEGGPPIEEKENRGGIQAEVAIEGIGIEEQQDGKGVNLYFEIVRRGEGDDKVNGFVMIVGMADGRYFTVPEGIDIKEGLPAAYKRGDRYSIKYRKKFVKDIRYNIESIKSLQVFVYSENGELLIRQGVKIR